MRSPATQLSTGVDPARVAAWARAVERGAIGEIRQVFADHRAQGPEIVWSPRTEQLVPPALRFLHQFWSAQARPGSLPHIRSVDPLEMRPALGFIILMDVLPGGADFRCRLFGSAVAAVSGFDMTG